MAAFNKTYTKLYDAYIRENEPDYIPDINVNAGKDTFLTRKLIRLNNRDQGIRLLLMDSYERYGQQGKMTLKVRKQMNRIDSIIAEGDASQSYVVPLLDPDNVDQLRAEIGLETLGDYLAG